MEEHLQPRAVASFFDQTPREVRLGIAVHAEQLAAPFLADAREQPHRVRLAHAAFQVDDRNGGAPTVFGMCHGVSVADNGSWQRANGIGHTIGTIVDGARRCVGCTLWWLLSHIRGGFQ